MRKTSKDLNNKRAYLKIFHYFDDISDLQQALENDTHALFKMIKSISDLKKNIGTISTYQIPK